MLKLSEIKVGAQIAGLVPNEIATIRMVTPMGDEAVSVCYKTLTQPISEQVLYPEDEERLSLVENDTTWSFSAPGNEFKLALEAYRIDLGACFDPMLAVHSSNIEPLPHQISAVYQAMLPKQPLRFVLADDPGAGKTIMAGLLIKELLLRADATRVLIVAPGSLTEQWQEEMNERFSLDFRIFSREMQTQSHSGNFFLDENLVIVRLDQIARNDDFRAKLEDVQWDLVVIDEAHKCSAHNDGAHITQRFKLAKILGNLTRHFLLMTATPHNGNDGDFYYWLSLLDGDRFGVDTGNTKLDITDVMRRLVKEELRKFDGTRLFPQRKAITINYELSQKEKDLYDEVTDYVRNEMNRAQKLDGQRRGQVGFALTILQRRLASSPEAIFGSLKRRYDKLNQRLEESLRLGRLADNRYDTYEKQYDIPKNLDEDEWDELEDECSVNEYDAVVDQILDRSTAANTVEELKKEIAALKVLKDHANVLVSSKEDCKWKRLAELLENEKEMKDEAGKRRKLIIFTEHRDTLDYLQYRITNLLGNNADKVRVIHGGTNRDTRRQIQEEFCNDPNVSILIATDAAGEGVNLQKANLMINYDLPWNPNRIEQRFGRIHRIGQTKTCFLWNLVAHQTREGAVFQRLFDKLEIEREALGGQVFDILGDVFEEVSLKKLLLDAILQEQSPEARSWMTEVDKAFDREHLKEIMARNKLVDQTMSARDMNEVKKEMDKAEARKLQPCYVRSFFLDAFYAIKKERPRTRENGRFEIPRVPKEIMGGESGTARKRLPIAKSYERICFEKEQINNPPTKPRATFIHPQHPLMKGAIQYILNKYQSLLKAGTVLIDRNDMGKTPSVLFLMDHCIKEADGDQPASRQLQFVRMMPDETPKEAGCAPHLDLAIPEESELAQVNQLRQQSRISSDLEQAAENYATSHIARGHYQRVRQFRQKQNQKIIEAVRERLNQAIQICNNKAQKIVEELAYEQDPKQQQRKKQRLKYYNDYGDDLENRRNERIQKLEQGMNLRNNHPNVIGGILVIPEGLLHPEKKADPYSADAEVRQKIEKIAMQAVIEKEESFGHNIDDVSADKCGWDITSCPPQAGDLIPESRYIEVKGRAKGADTVTVTYNETITGVNLGEKYILAIVLVDGDKVEGPFYIKKPFDRELAPEAVSQDLKLAELLKRAVVPEATL